MLPEHEGGALAVLGKREHYEADRGRHSNLAQIREFKDRPLVKVEVAIADPAVIRRALDAVGARRSAA